MPSNSIINIFKIGVGPSSSHTVGPWIAAFRFMEEEIKGKIMSADHTIVVDLYGSLAHTGIGHGTDFAILMGLCGHQVDEVNEGVLSEAHRNYNNIQKIRIGHHFYSFNTKNINFWKGEFLPYHPNGMTFRILGKDDLLILSKTYYSIGGGFVLSEDELDASSDQNKPSTLSSVQAIRELLNTTGKSLFDILNDHELKFRPKYQTMEQLENIYQVMIECAHKGCHTDGILPGGLSLKRRAKAKHARLMPERDYHNVNEWLTAIRRKTFSFRQTIDWVSCLAIAVNEENAAFGKIVTAPTNGSAGVIPSVLIFSQVLLDLKTTQKDVLEFLFIAGMIGQLYKNGATLSAAAGGCQAEIGVSSSMAAAGLTHTLGGSTEQIFMAAEIAMEHHLGLTCDPVNGLVQVPCIERNSIGAIKAITAAQLAMNSDPSQAKVSLDEVIKSMWETAKDMNAKYRETSLGGLATNVMLPEC